MEYRTLGRTDLQVSAIALGGATFGREIEEPAAWRILDRAIERGITLLDTAESYSDRASEKMIGRWLSQTKNRQKIVPGHEVRVQRTTEREDGHGEDRPEPRVSSDRLDRPLPAAPLAAGGRPAG